MTRFEDPHRKSRFQRLWMIFAMTAMIMGGAVLADTADNPGPRMEKQPAPAFKATCTVLIVTPDSSEGVGDISKILDVLDDYEDVDVTVWDNSTGTPGFDDLTPYDVVIFGNENEWTDVAELDVVAFGNALADYLDNGGKVIESNFVQSYDEWAFNGRYVSEGYSPFTRSTQDIWQEADLVFTMNSHPILDGVAALHDIYGHQDPGLRKGATLLATWSGTEARAIAFNENVIAFNMILFDDSDWTGDLPTLLYNSIRWLCIDSGPTWASYLPHFVQQVDVWNTILSLSNPTGVPQNIIVEAYDDQGAKGLVASAEHTLPAQGGLSQPVGEYFTGLSAEIGWIKIRSYDRRVKGIMKFTFLPTGATASLTTVYLTTGKLIFSSMELNDQWQSSFAVVNPRESEAACTATAYALDGTLVGTAIFQIPPRAKYVGFLTPELFSVSALPGKMILLVESDLDVTGFALLLNGDYTELVAVPAESYGN